jgi:predicted GIY-YIG superfamily endonuclease
MNFDVKEQRDFITIPKYKNSFVYLLLKGNDVVYVGQTTQGISRPLSHKDKDFDTIKLKYCNPYNLDFFEDIYIKKYKPKYNKQLNYSLNWGLKRVRDLIRNETVYFDITLPKLKNVLKKLNIEVYFDEYTQQNMISSMDKDVLLDFLKTKQREDMVNGRTNK